MRILRAFGLDIVLVSAKKEDYYNVAFFNTIDLLAIIGVDFLIVFYESVFLYCVYEEENWE